MPMQRYKPEQIVTMLRQIEVGIANGKNTPQACKEAAITVQTIYRWRKEYGGLKMDQAKRLKELEKENGKLKRLVAELSLEPPGGEIVLYFPAGIQPGYAMLPCLLNIPDWAGYSASICSKSLL